MTSQPFDAWAYRRLWAAIIWRAYRDAIAGDKAAADWLLCEAELSAGDVVGIPFEKLAHFAAECGATSNGPG